MQSINGSMLGMMGQEAFDFTKNKNGGTRVVCPFFVLCNMFLVGQVTRRHDLLVDSLEIRQAECFTSQPTVLRLLIATQQD
jgi:hypothetical protein